MVQENALDLLGVVEVDDVDLASTLAEEEEREVKALVKDL